MNEGNVKEETASEMLERHFNKLLDLGQGYCQWVLDNVAREEARDIILNREPEDFRDNGIPTMDLRMEL